MKRGDRTSCCIYDRSGKDPITIRLSRKCLKYVSLNALVHFVANFPEKLCNLQMNIDWVDMYERKEQDELVEKDDGKILSPIGIPLLSLCFENELNAKGDKSKFRLRNLIIPLVAREDKEEGLYGGN